MRPNTLCRAKSAIEILLLSCGSPQNDNRDLRLDPDKFVACIEWRLGEDVAAEKIARSFPAADDAGALAFDEDFRGTAAGVVIRSE